MRAERRPTPDPPCKVCGGPTVPSHRARGMCWACYLKWRRVHSKLTKSTKVEKKTKES